MTQAQLQLLVRKHYCGGEFAHVETPQELWGCGDTLFKFLMYSAADAESVTEFNDTVERAIGQLRDLQQELT